MLAETGGAAAAPVGAEAAAEFAPLAWVGVAAAESAAACGRAVTVETRASRSAVVVKRAMLAV